MSKLARDRGANYEREVATAVFDTLGIKIKRNLQQYQTAELGDLELGPFLIECKRRRKIAVYEWMEQADKACDVDHIPVVIFRGDGKKSMAMFHLEDALKLMGNELTHLSQSREFPSRKPIRTLPVGNGSGTHHLT
jgi:hypothetical protein